MAALHILKPVGKNCPNDAADVEKIAAALRRIGKLPAGGAAPGYGPPLLAAIEATQRHWMPVPDGVISPNGRTLRFLSTWSVKPVKAGVKLPGNLQVAWDWVNPILPAGSLCTSGYRSIEAQRAILADFYRIDYRREIVAKYTQAVYDEVDKDLVKNEDRALAMVKAVGQAVAKPGKSAHQSGKALDIGGPDDDGQVSIVKLVAKAHPDLFSGKVIKERNGCVHFEIR